MPQSITPGSNPKEVRISITTLCQIALDAYSRPEHLVPRMVCEIVYLYSRRGATTLDDIERVALQYTKQFPQSSTPINIFLARVRKTLRVE